MTSLTQLSPLCPQASFFYSMSRSTPSWPACLHSPCMSCCRLWTITNQRGKTGSPRQVQHPIRQSAPRSRLAAWRWTPSCLCHSQGWWLDPKQMRPSRLSIPSRKPKAGTCMHRRWTSSWDVSLASSYSSPLWNILYFRVNHFYPVHDSFTVPSRRLPCSGVLVRLSHKPLQTK